MCTYRDDKLSGLKLELNLQLNQVKFILTWTFILTNNM